MYLRQHGLKSRQEFAEHRANHFGVFRDSGLEVKQYRYYDKKTISLDLDGMIEDLKVIRYRCCLIVGCSEWFNYPSTCLRS
jgi:aspartate/tyrosine/aromatic aminotransferase